MRLLHQTATFSLTHDPVRNWLYSQWTGVNPTAIARAECEVILACVCRLKCTKLLNNSLADEDGWAGLIDWMAEHFIEQLAQEGIVAIAWVLPIHSIALCTTQRVLHKYTLLGRKKPLVDVFIDVESAYTWLMRWPKADNETIQESPQ